MCLVEFSSRRLNIQEEIGRQGREETHCFLGGKIVTDIVCSLPAKTQAIRRSLLSGELGVSYVCRADGYKSIL